MNKLIIHNKNEQFAEVVSMIQHTRNEVVRLANASLIDLYWKIGKYISNKIAASEWGDGVVKQLADYIERTSPETKGFSDKNLWRMKQFYETYNGADEKLSPLVRQISWTNNLTILSRTKSTEERCFYLEDTFCFWVQISKEGVPKVDTPYLVLTSIKNKSLALTYCYKEKGHPRRNAPKINQPITN